MLAGDALPRVNALVDLYNAASIELAFAWAATISTSSRAIWNSATPAPGDTFFDMSAADGEDPLDPPKDGEVVYADAKQVLCRRWNWRQDARTLVTPKTRRIVLTAQSNGYGDVEAAATRAFRGDLARVRRRSCRSSSRPRDNPVHEF